MSRISSESALFDHFRVVARYGRWIAALVGGIALGTYVATASSPDAYRATTAVRFVVPEVATSGSSARDSADLLGTSFAAAADTDAFALRVQAEGVDLTVDEIDEHVQVGQDLVPGFLTVTATADSAAGAADRADRVARALTGFIRAEQDAVVATAMAPLQRRLDELGALLDRTDLGEAERVRLTEQALQVSATMAEQEQSLRPTLLTPDPAPVPTEPYAPRPGRRALTMALLAFVLSVEGLVVFRYLRGLLPLGDPAGELGRLTEAPVLELGAVRRRRAATPILPFVLQHLADRRVISVVQRNGAPTALPGSVIADALSRSGSRVLLVDADTRAPQLHAELDVPLRPGLVEVVTGDERLRDAVHPSPTGSGVVVLSAGVPTDAADVATVANGGLEALVRQAGADVNVVVTSSATPLEDALLVVHQFPEAVVLAVDARSARRAEVVETVRLIRSIGGNVVGTLCIHTPAPGWRESLGRLRRAA